jgi:hypothetical protein
MVRVVDYREGLIEFYCDKCNHNRKQDINDLLEDNCVLDIEVVCSSCKEMAVLYVVRCKDEYEMKYLNAQLKLLKEVRNEKS